MVFPEFSFMTTYYYCSNEKKYIQFKGVEIFLGGERKTLIIWIFLKSLKILCYMNKEKQNGVPVKSRFRTYRELNPASTANHTIPRKLLIFLYLGVYTHKMGIDKSTCLIELLVSIQGVNLCKILTVFYSAFANSKHVCIHQLLFTSQKIYWKETILFC